MGPLEPHLFEVARQIDATRSIAQIGDELGGEPERARRALGELARMGLVGFRSPEALLNAAQVSG